MSAAEEGGFFYQISSLVAEMFVAPQPDVLKYDSDNG